MAQWTLDQILTEIATHTDTTDGLVKTGGAYAGDALTLANRFTSSVNYAMGKVARERFAPVYSETVTLGADLKITLSSLSKRFVRLISLEDAYGSAVDWEKAASWKLYCPYQKSGDVLTVEYEYAPADFSAATLTTTLDFPEIIDPRMFCFFAAYDYLYNQADQQSLIMANRYLTLWNDAFNTIPVNIGEISMIEDVYDCGGEP